MTHFVVFRSVSQSSVDSDIATAFQRRFHISVDDSEQNNVSALVQVSLFIFISSAPNLFFDFIACWGRFYHLLGFTLFVVFLVNEFDLEKDESADIDAASDDEGETQVPAGVETNAEAHLESMEMLVDEEEVFISELMAMHPNDDDIVVEDLEEVAREAEEAIEDGVRQINCKRRLLYRSLLLNFLVVPLTLHCSFIFLTFHFLHEIFISNFSLSLCACFAHLNEPVNETIAR